MKWTHARAFVAAAFTIGFSAFAQAEAIYFDFTGTITSSGAPLNEGAVVGAAFSAGFNFETDRMVKSTYPPNYTVFGDYLPTNLAEPLAFANFGGREVTLPIYGFNNFNSIEFIDNCPSGGPCIPGTYENFNLYSYTNDGEAEADFTGTLHTTSLQINAGRWTREPGNPNIVALDYFDGATVDPLLVVDLPLYQVIGFFGEDTQTCFLGECTYESRQFSFSLDTVTRGVGPRSVPEPGTLVLFVTAIGGMWLARRRRATK